MIMAGAEGLAAARPLLALGADASWSAGCGHAMKALNNRVSPPG